MKIYNLEQRLADIARDFFCSKLRAIVLASEQRPILRGGEELGRLSAERPGRVTKSRTPNFETPGISFGHVPEIRFERRR